jgi:hypothetical protein
MEDKSVSDEGTPEGTPEGTDQGGNNSGTTPPAGNEGFKPPATQEELNRIIAERVKRAEAKYAGFGDLKKKAEQFDAIAEAQKTELQRSQERAEAAEKRAAEVERELVRSQVAVTKKLPAELAARLRGDTPEELAADADALLALMKTSNSLKPDPSQGSRSAASPDPAQQFADLILKARGNTR